MFALLAAFLGVLVIVGVDIPRPLWWWLTLIALHLAFGGGVPLAPSLPWKRKRS